MTALHSGLVGHVIAHTHWDREWYLPFERFRYRLIEEVIVPLLETLERDPHYRAFHLDAQSIVLEDIVAVRPELEAALRRHIREQRVLVGPWFVQPDEFLVSGEALVRNLLIGSELAEHWGHCSKVGYLPDAFGHTGQMPQILRGFGVDTFVAARGVTLETLGGVEFWWEGVNGTRLRGQLMPTWYNNLQRLPVGQSAVEAYVKGAYQRLGSAVRSGHALLMNGVDHFSPQGDLTERLLEARQAGIELRHSTLEEALEATRQSGVEAPVVRGELLAELTDSCAREGSSLLTGTLSSRVYLKQANAAAEQGLERYAEPLGALTHLLGGPDDAPFLRYAWKLLLENHAHDSICGCSIDAVHREMMARFERVAQLTTELVERRLDWLGRRAILPPGDSLDEPSALTASGGQPTAPSERPLQPAPRGLIVFNPLPHPRHGVIELELDLPIRNAAPGTSGLQPTLTGPHGRRVPLQVLRSSVTRRKELGHDVLPVDRPVARYRVAAQLELPALGYITLSVGHAVALEPGPGQRTGPCGLENEHVKLEVNADGSVDLLDKASGRVWPGLNALIDSGDVGDAYDYIAPDDNPHYLPGRVTATAMRDGPLWSELSVHLEYQVPEAARPDRLGRHPRLVTLETTVRYRLLAGEAAVEVEVQLDNHALDHRLRASFPLGAAAGTARAAGAFDVVDRAARPPSWWAFPSRNHAMHGMVSVEARGGTLALFTHGLYEYDLDPSGTLALTLLRAVGHMFVDPQSRAPSDAVPEAQCLGPQRLRYALKLYAQAPSELDLLRDRDRYLLQPVSLPAFGGDELPGEQAGLRLENAALTAFKTAQDGQGVVVRGFNPSSASVQIHWRWPSDLLTTQCALDETFNHLDPVKPGLNVPSKGIFTLRGCTDPCGPFLT